MDLEDEIEDFRIRISSKLSDESQFEEVCDLFKRIINEQSWNKQSPQFKEKSTRLSIEITEKCFLMTPENCDDKEDPILAHYNSDWFITAVLTVTESLKWMNGDDIIEDLKLLKLLTISCFCLCVSFAVECPPNCSLVCKEAVLSLQAELSMLCFRHSEAKLTDFIHLNQGQNKLFVEGLLAKLLLYLQPKLSKENWKQSSCFKHVFYFTLSSAKNDQISLHLNKFLPPSLLFTDDYNAQNQILGIKCLHKSVASVSGAEIRLYGKADVIYNALHHLTYIRDPKIIDELHPCLLAILSVIEKPEDRMSVTWSKHDSVFQHILNEMEFEQNLSLRRSYSRNLHLFIDQLQIDCLKHIQRFIRVMKNYLEVSDGKEEIARKNMLLALDRLIFQTWPRIFSHVQNILQALLKLIYSLDDCDTSAEVKNQLLKAASKCVCSLREVEPEKFDVLCSCLDVKSMPPEMSHRWNECLQSLDKKFASDSYVPSPKIT